MLLRPLVIRCVLWAACALLCALPSPAFAAASPTTTDIITPVLSLAGRFCGSLLSCYGGTVTAEVISEPAGQGYFMKKHIGQPKYRDVTMRFGFHMTASVYEWISNSWNGNNERRDGAVSLADTMGNVRSGCEFFQAQITETTIPACDATSKLPDYLTVTFAPEYTRTAKAGTKTELSLNQEQKRWFPTNFRLTIDGLDCSRVVKIDSFTIRQAAVTADIGEARDALKVPGKIAFPNLRITLPRDSVAGWQQWHKAFVVDGDNDDACEKDGSLVFLNYDRQRELFRINLFNLGIYSLEDQYDSSGRLTPFVVADLYCERMELPTRTMGAPASTTASTTMSNTAPSNSIVPQVPAGPGEFGKTYRMRTADPLNFSLQSAEYTVDPVTIGDKCYIANADQKLLVLHFTVGNPNDGERLVRFDQLRIAAVTAGDQMKYAQEPAWGTEQTHKTVGYNLQAGQQVPLFAVVKVPAKDAVGTILVRSNRDNDGPDLPYDAREQITALSAPYADPKDTTGATALPEVPAKAETAYPLTNYTATLEKMAFATGPLGDMKLDQGQCFLVCLLAVKNHTPQEQLLRYDMLQPILTTEPGEPLPYKGMLYETTDRPVVKSVAPGDTVNVRLIFAVPKGVTPAKLLLRENKSRRYRYAVKG